MCPFPTSSEISMPTARTECLDSLRTTRLAQELLLVSNFKNSLSFIY